MSQRADRLFADAQELPSEERALLALQLLDSVGQPEPEVERAWLEEVHARLADVDGGRAELSSWEDARRRIFARK